MCAAVALHTYRHKYVRIVHLAILLSYCAARNGRGFYCTVHPQRRVKRRRGCITPSVTGRSSNEETPSRVFYVHTVARRPAACSVLRRPLGAITPVG